jgi:serine/threonine protein kinase/Flp pilus assembly protein TadD
MESKASASILPLLIRSGDIAPVGCFALEKARMNSASPSFTVRNQLDPDSDQVSAFRIALQLFGVAELSEFLPPREHPRYLEILSELVRTEMAHDARLGKPASLEIYRARYPDLFADPVLVYRITRAEFHHPQEAGENSITLVSPVRAESPQDTSISALDAAASSKVDDGEGSQSYPVTERKTRNHPALPAPDAEIGPTRLGLAADRRRGQTPEPEIALKLTEATLQMPKVGDEFLGFRLLAELGKGAFGKVFLAQQGQLAGRHVALKIATGLFSESQTLAQLQHTHIVPIYSYHNGQPFQAVCMPYLGSTTLAHVLADIRTNKSMPSSGKDLLSTLNDRKKSTRRTEDSSKNSSLNPAHEQQGADADETPQSAPATTPARALALEGMSYVDSILWLAVRLADGLAHAHEQGIIHRDLKPANILLTDDGLPMLLDFNLAQDNKVQGSGSAASMGGTLPYMAPEHLEAFRGNAAPVDARSDLFSLGVILFELLTGAAPFPSYSKLPTREIVNRMIQDRRQGAPGLRRLNRAIPPAVEAIVRRCLEVDPEKRYQTARQLQEDLQRQLEQKPLRHAANPSLWERCQKFRKRHPRLTSVTSVAAVFCLLIAGMAVAYGAHEEQLRRLEAKETLSRFRIDAETAYWLLNARTAKDNIPEAQRTCRSALGFFQILESPDWRQGPAVRRLPEQERQRLQAEAGQLLVLLAHSQQLAGDRESNPTRRREMFHEGLQVCSQAIDCFGHDQAPLALSKLQGELHKRLGDVDKAQHFFDRAKQSDFKTAQDRYLTALLLAEEGKFRDALPLVREAIRSRPQDFNLHFWQGVCHDKLGQHAEAVNCYRTCIALRPKFYGAYYNRGLSYLWLCSYALAVADFDEAIRLNPDFVETYLQRGLAFQGLKKYTEAIADFTEALDRGETQTRVYFMRATAREKAGDLEGAKKDFAEGMRREPTDELSFIARGIAYLPTDPKRADPKRALSDFDQALKLNPKSLAALHNKAIVLGKYFKLNKEAVDALNEAVKLYPGDVRPLVARGVYLARLGNRKDAVRDAELAAKIDSGRENLYLIACIYALTSRQEPDDRDEALLFLSTALKRGYGFRYLERDPDLNPIRNSPTFIRLLEGARAMRTAEAARKSK